MIYTNYHRFENYRFKYYHMIMFRGKNGGNFSIVILKNKKSYGLFGSLEKEGE